MYDEYNNGLCPQCMLEDKSVELIVNAIDLWECTICRLQMHNSNPLFMVVMRTRGNGNLRGFSAVFSWRAILPIPSSNSIFDYRSLVGYRVGPRWMPINA